MTVTIVVIAKEPRPGRVKTRLCPPCTAADAARIAQAALHDTLDAVAGTPAAGRVVAFDGIPGPWFPAGRPSVIVAAMSTVSGTRSSGRNSFSTSRCHIVSTPP